MKHLLLFFFIEAMFLANLFGVSGSEIKFNLFAKEADVIQFEIELWKTNDLNGEIPRVVLTNQGRVNLLVPSGYFYFRVRSIAKFQVRGYWSELFSVNGFGSEKPKPTVAKKSESKTPQSNILIPIPDKSGNQNLFLTESKVRIAPITGSQKNIQYYYRYDKGPWIKMSNPELNFEKEGNYVLEYKSIDILGNEELPKQLTFGVDRTPPQTSVSMSGHQTDRFLSQNSKIKFETTDSGSGVKQTEFRNRCQTNEWSEWIILNSTEIPWYENYKLCETHFELEVRSIDNVGNVETPIKTIFLKAK
ncbi:hypothetical protein P3G55_02880 [Leptospira sp. 96542]|nr:hypothetical protein [Leptospira sp. 96542]